MRIQSPKKRESSRRSNENPVAEEKDFGKGQENRDTNLEKKRSTYVEEEEEVERRTTGNIGRRESTELSLLDIHESSRWIG